MFHHDLTHTGASDTSAPSTNQTLWKFSTGGQMGSPTVIGGVVYVGSYDNKIYAFNAKNGAVIWKYTTGGRVVSCPAVAGGVVYVGSDDSYLYALGQNETQQFSAVEFFSAFLIVALGIACAAEYYYWRKLSLQRFK
jgi:outer membrane protein assembly factor BamB